MLGDLAPATQGWATVPRVRRLVIAALLGSTLVLTACGGGGDDAGRAAPRLSAAHYRAQLGQLCTDSEREAAKIGGVQGANADAEADYFDKIAAMQTRRRAQFERLRPPADLQAEHAQIGPLLAQEIAAVRQAATSLRAGSDIASTYQAFKVAEVRVLRRQYKVLDKLKVSECRGGSSSGTSTTPGTS